MIFVVSWSMLFETLFLVGLLLIFDMFAILVNIKNHAHYESHMIHMLVHGIYHILGYDHEADDKAIVMEEKETLILKSIGISNPYK